MKHNLSEKIKFKAIDLGFDKIGIAKAGSTFFRRLKVLLSLIFPRPSLILENILGSPDPLLTGPATSAIVGLVNTDGAAACLVDIHNSAGPVNAGALVPN